VGQFDCPCDGAALPVLQFRSRPQNAAHNASDAAGVSSCPQHARNAAPRSTRLPTRWILVCRARIAAANGARLRLSSAQPGCSRRILNDVFVFGASLPAKTRAYVFNFLRRAEGASSAYRVARIALIEYLETPRNVLSPYFRALLNFEVCISQCYQGYELLATASGQKFFEPWEDVRESVRVKLIEQRRTPHQSASPI
jgi:hypothetical protein